MLKKNLLALFIIIAVVVIIALPYTGKKNVAHARENFTAIPTNVQVTATTNTSVTISWNTVPEATSYYVDKWLPGTQNWTTVAQVIAPTTTYTDTSLNCIDPEKAYGDYYRVSAYNSNDGQQSEPTGWLLGSPLNDKFSGAVNITTVPGSILQTTCNANRTTYAADPEVPNCNMNKGLSTVWYKYTATADTAVSFNTEGADYDTFIAVWTGDQADYDFNSLTPIACNNNTGGAPQSSVGFQTTTGVTYYIEIGQYDGATGTAATSLDAASGPPLSEQIR